MPELRVLLDDSVRPALEQVALGPALLRKLLADGGSELARVYVPEPTLALSGKDCVTPGVDTAAAAAAALGFTPVRRGPGGRAVAYHRSCLGIDHVGIAGPDESITGRFASFAEFYRQLLRSLGVPAEVGPVPGEFCPGDHSVNDGNGHKVIGTAQRLTRSGWLFSTMIMVGDTAPLREVLEVVYPALGMQWDPGTVAGLEDTVPGLTVPTVSTELTAAFAARYDLVLTEMPSLGPDLARHLPPTGFRTPESTPSRR